ncbi:DoxX family protein [Nonomuraea cavernae]|uniref:DoxX family protein n=1 Tax=Nonomuraea cavernae TaxID=2045107 RepID=UPI0033FBAE3D
MGGEITMKRSLFDLAALISRVTIGVIFIAHGWQKWQAGLGATAQHFAQTGVPVPQLAAGFTMVAEIVGGALLILGLFVRVSALALLVVSVGALVFVHGSQGIFEWELVGSLAAICLLFLAVSGGRLGLDGLLRRIHRRRAERELAESGTTKRTSSATTRPAPTSRESTPGETTRGGATSGGTTSGETATRPMNVPRQTRAPRSGDLSDQDMRDIDAIIDEPTKRRPPNR